MSDERPGLQRLSQLAHERLGLDLQRGAVASAVARYIDRFTSVERAIEAAERDATFQELVDAVTVQHSWLFRDHHQLEVGCKALAGDSGPARPAVWVPACATGEDVYTLLALARTYALDLTILGTDVHEQALEHARQGRYTSSSTRHVPAEFSWLLLGTGEARSVASDVRKKAAFRAHNLLEPAPRSTGTGGRWDLIVCRNVLIYFSATHTRRALAHLRDALSPGGLLVLGASDIMTDLPEGLVATERDGRVVFVRSGQQVQAAATSSTLPAQELPAAAAAFRRARTLTRGTAASETASGGLPGPRPRGSDADAHEQLGLGLEAYWSGELIDASRALRAAVYLAPDLWPAWYYLGQCHDGLGRFPEARRAYAQALAHLDTKREVPIVRGHDFTLLRADVRAAISSRLQVERAR